MTRGRCTGAGSGSCATGSELAASVVEGVGGVCTGAGVTLGAAATCGEAEFVEAGGTMAGLGTGAGFFPAMVGATRSGSLIGVSEIATEPSMIHPSRATNVVVNGFSALLRSRPCALYCALITLSNGVPTMGESPLEMMKMLRLLTE